MIELFTKVQIVQVSNLSMGTKIKSIRITSVIFLEIGRGIVTQVSM